MNGLAVVARDRVGLLADVSETLGKNGINIGSIALEVSKQTAIIRIQSSDNKAAKKVLSSSGFKVIDAGTLMIRVNDKPGELAKISRQLANNGINITNIFILDEKSGSGEKVVALITDNNPKAKKVLDDYLA